MVSRRRGVITKGYLNKMDFEKLQEIYDEQGRPGAQAFRFAVRRAGIEISETEAKAFVARQGIGQVFQGRIPSDGVVPGGGREDHRWQMDLIDFSKRITKINQGHKYVLIAVDNFDRTIFTVPMPRKTAVETLTAFRKLIRQNDGVMPKQITVDNGNEYNLLKDEIERAGGVLTRKNMQAINTLSVIDRTIGKLKTILSAYSLTNWADSLKKATRVYNNRQHSYLMGSAPDDVKGSSLLQYELEKTHGEQIKHNNDKWRQRAGRLRDAGAFRVPRERDTWERIDKPKFGGEVYNVDSFKGANVESGDKTFPVKTALPVPRGSLDVDLGIDDGERNQGRRAKQREMLGDYARDLRNLIPDTGLTLAAATRALQGMRGFLDTVELYGPSKSGRYVSFLKLFPNLFKITGSGTEIKVFKADPVAPRPPQVGGSSSSTEPPPRERVPRAIEVNPRIVLYPHYLKVKFSQENPAQKVGSQRYLRYERYKKATTMGQARDLGLTTQDIQLDLAAGALVFE